MTPKEEALFGPIPDQTPYMRIDCDGGGYIDDRGRIADAIERMMICAMRLRDSAGLFCVPPDHTHSEVARRHLQAFLTEIIKARP